MIARFYVQPSKIVCLCLLGLYLLAAIALTQFHLAVMYKWTLFVCLGLSAVRFLIKWRKSAILCEYNANKDRWQVSKATGEWIQVFKIRAIYVTDRCAWINFHTGSGKVIAVLIGADALPADKFLQLRRSVICPAVLRSGSA